MVASGKGFRHWAAVQWGAAVVLPILCTTVSSALDGSMSLAGLSMTYLLGVVTASLFLSRAPATLASILCVGALNYFFVPPRRSLAVTGAESWWILAALLSVAVLVSALLSSARERRAQAESARNRSQELHALAQALGCIEGAEGMARVATDLIHRVLQRPCALFLWDATDDRLRTWQSPAGGAFDPEPVKWCLANGRVVGVGTANWPQLPLWCAPFSRHGPTGAIQVLIDPHRPPSPDVLEHWLDMVNQVGGAIDRERASATALAAQQAARAETVRNTLLASLAHDLRTPLSALLGTATALRMHGETMTRPQQQRLLANLEDEALDMTLMADNILQIARLSQPQTGLQLQWESLEDVLGAAVTRMRRRWPDTVIQLKVPGELPPIRAEAGLMAQAIANLIDNAVRHGASGSPVVVQAGRSRAGVFVAVRDHGPGLPEGQPAELFRRWHRGRTGTGGTGLGLTICQLCVEAHGGVIDAADVHPGAEFRIDLPVGAPANTPG